MNTVHSVTEWCRISWNLSRTHRRPQQRQVPCLRRRACTHCCSGSVARRTECTPSWYRLAPQILPAHSMYQSTNELFTLANLSDTTNRTDESIRLPGRQNLLVRFVGWQISQCEQYTMLVFKCLLCISYTSPLSVSQWQQDNLLLSITSPSVDQFSQESQLSLINHATHLEVSQGHQTWYYSIC